MSAEVNPNDSQPPYAAFALGVTSSIVGSLLLAFASWSATKAWFLGALVGALWLCLTAGMAIVFRRSYRAALHHERVKLASEQRQSVTFVRQMTRSGAKKRIRTAKHEIWSFQISGSEFTAHSTEAYETWLRNGEDRRLRIAFANPEKPDLFKSIAKLGGQDKLSGADHAYAHLRATAETSLDKYIALRERFPDQVDVRVYDFSPPYSIHAVDPGDDNEAAGSVFVEFYLPDLPSSERPCMLLQQDHESFALYRNQSLVWFKDSTPAESGQ